MTLIETLMKPVNILLGFTFLFLCIQLYFYAKYYFAPVRARRKRSASKEHNGTSPLPSVSVIICARNEARNLRQYLPAVLEQDYDSYEVIVVNDDNSAEQHAVINELQAKYSNLRESFIPKNASVISRKKLALTIGIKAAQNELLLFTDADCYPVSANWIRSMVQHFDNSTELVLGYGGYIHHKGFVNRLITYDTLFTAMQYMGCALKGNPYMGVGRNLAYRKSTFMQHNGFAGMLHLQSGDDDLFVNAVANSHNTQVEFSAESITLSEPKRTFKEWIIQRERHLSTAHCYKKANLNRIGFEVLSRGMLYATVVATLCMGELCSLYALIPLFIKLAVQIAAINSTAALLNEKRHYASVLLFDMLLPLINLFLLLRIRLFYKRNHTYSWK